MVAQPQRPCPLPKDNWLREGTSLTVGDRVDVRVKSVDGPNRRVIVQFADAGAQHHGRGVGMRGSRKEEPSAFRRVDGGICVSHGRLAEWCVPGRGNDHRGCADVVRICVFLSLLCSSRAVLVVVSLQRCWFIPTKAQFNSFNSLMCDSGGPTYKTKLVTIFQLLCNFCT